MSSFWFAFLTFYIKIEFKFFSSLLKMKLSFFFVKNEFDSFILKWTGFFLSVCWSERTWILFFCCKTMHFAWNSCAIAAKWCFIWSWQFQVLRTQHIFTNWSLFSLNFFFSLLLLRSQIIFSKNREIFSFFFSPLLVLWEMYVSCDVTILIARHTGIPIALKVKWMCVYRVR